MKIKLDLDITGLGFVLLTFLRDYSGILAIIVTILLYFLYQRKKKSITYTQLSKELLFKIREEMKGKLKVLYEGNIVEELHLLIIRLQNSGNVTILPKDFETSITIELNNEAQILSNDVIETKPEKLVYTVYVSGNAVQLGPMLLNKGESITLKMLISKFTQIKSVYGRIVDISEIKEVDKEVPQIRAARITGIVPIVLAVFLYYFMPVGTMNIVIVTYIVMGLLIILFPKQFRQVMKHLGPQWAR